jgi:hypothetical protein
MISRKRLACGVFGCELAAIESLASTSGKY